MVLYRRTVYVVSDLYGVQTVLPQPATIALGIPFITFLSVVVRDTNIDYPLISRIYYHHYM